MVIIQVTLSILVLFLSWLGLKKIALDNCRDRLFDIRQNVRQYFVNNYGGLSHPVYKSLRDMLNSHIRFTEEFSLVSFLIILHHVKHVEKNSLLSRFTPKEESRFREIIDYTRKESFLALMNFLFQTSVVLTIFSVVYSMVKFFKSFKKPPKNPYKEVSGRFIKPKELEWVSLTSDPRIAGAR